MNQHDKAATSFRYPVVGMSVLMKAVILFLNFFPFYALSDGDCKQLAQQAMKEAKKGIIDAEVGLMAVDKKIERNDSDIEYLEKLKQTKNLPHARLNQINERIEELKRHNKYLKGDRENFMQNRSAMNRSLSYAEARLAACTPDGVNRNTSKSDEAGDGSSPERKPSSSDEINVRNRLLSDPKVKKAVQDAALEGKLLAVKIRDYIPGTAGTVPYHSDIVTLGLDKNGNIEIKGQHGLYPNAYNNGTRSDWIGRNKPKDVGGVFRILDQKYVDTNQIIDLQGEAAFQDAQRGGVNQWPGYSNCHAVAGRTWDNFCGN